jgi:hypothetical protein
VIAYTFGRVLAAADAALASGTKRVSPARSRSSGGRR